MTEKDAKIIFMNIADIAMFSDMFTERLEEALGAALEGGTGEDHVGALFLEMVRLRTRALGSCVSNFIAFIRYLNWNHYMVPTLHGIQPLWNI